MFRKRPDIATVTTAEHQTPAHGSFFHRVITSVRRPRAGSVTVDEPQYSYPLDALNPDHSFSQDIVFPMSEYKVPFERNLFDALYDEALKEDRRRTFVQPALYDLFAVVPQEKEKR